MPFEILRAFKTQGVENSRGQTQGVKSVNIKKLSYQAPIANSRGQKLKGSSLLILRSFLIKHQ